MRSNWQWLWGFFGGDENVLKLTVVFIAQLCGYTENHQIIHFKLVNCIPIKLVFLFGRHKKRGLQGATLATLTYTAPPPCTQIAASQPLRAPLGPSVGSSPRLALPSATGNLSTISINSPVVPCLKPGRRRQPGVQIQPQDSGQQLVQLSQRLHCSSVIESTQMREGREHSCREESLAVVPPISSQATPRCPQI